jgi:hypothetical protein
MTEEHPKDDLLLKEFGENIWISEGPEVNFFSIPYPTRMAVVKLSDGKGAWIWSPVQWSEELGKQVEEKVGPVQHIVSPNKIHHIFLQEWSQKYPNAKVYAPPGLAGRSVVQDVVFHQELKDEAPEEYQVDVEQVIFRGSCFMEEVVFFHKVSSTCIVGDLIQRHAPSDGWKGFLMKSNDCVGSTGSTPREWRWSFWNRTPIRESRDKIIFEWKPKKLLIAHGENATENATPVIKNALKWM